VFTSLLRVLHSLYTTIPDEWHAYPDMQKTNDCPQRRRFRSLRIQDLRTATDSHYRCPLLLLRTTPCLKNVPPLACYNF